MEAIVQAVLAVTGTCLVIWILTMLSEIRKGVE